MLWGMKAITHMRILEITARNVKVILPNVINNETRSGDNAGHSGNQMVFMVLPPNIRWLQRKANTDSGWAGDHRQIQKPQ